MITQTPAWPGLAYTGRTYPGVEAVVRRDLTIYVAQPIFVWTATFAHRDWDAKVAAFVWMAKTDPFMWAALPISYREWESTVQPFAWEASSPAFAWTVSLPHFD